MRTMRVMRWKSGHLSLCSIPPVVAMVLSELPGHLGSDQPEAVRKRLFPDPGGDDEFVAEWRRRQHPELFALLADSRRIVESDLAKLKTGAGGRESRLEIPPSHVNAWISALNAARLALGAVHDVKPGDLDPDFVPPRDERGAAIVRIDLYAWVQGLLIDAAQHAG